VTLAIRKGSTSLETEIMGRSMKPTKSRTLKWERGDRGNSCGIASNFSGIRSQVYGRAVG
jgi:hypothetical protein